MRVHVLPSIELEEHHPCMCKLSEKPFMQMMATSQSNNKHLLVRLEWPGGDLVCAVCGPSQQHDQSRKWKKPSSSQSYELRIQHFVEMSMSLMRLHSLKPGKQVSIHHVTDLQQCFEATALVEDRRSWLAMATNMNHLEQGLLLQLRVIKAGRTFPISVHGRSVALSIQYTKNSAGIQCDEWMLLVNDSKVLVGESETNQDGTTMPVLWEKLRVLIANESIDVPVCVSTQLKPPSAYSFSKVFLFSYHDVMHTKETKLATEESSLHEHYQSDTNIYAKKELETPHPSASPFKYKSLHSIGFSAELDANDILLDPRTAKSLCLNRYDPVILMAQPAEALENDEDEITSHSTNVQLQMSSYIPSPEPVLVPELYQQYILVLKSALCPFLLGYSCQSSSGNATESNSHICTTLPPTSTTNHTCRQFLLVTGVRGSGRSTLCNWLGKVLDNECNVFISKLACASLKGSSAGHKVNALRLCIRIALDRAPSVIILDDLDVFCPAELQGPEDMVFLAQVARLLGDIPVSSRIAVVVTSVDPEAINTSVIETISFLGTLTVSPLSPKSLDAVLREVIHAIGVISKDQSESLVSFFKEKKRKRFVVRDIIHIFRLAQIAQLRRGKQPGNVSVTDIQDILQNYRPLHFGSDIATPTAFSSHFNQSTVQFKDIGGLADAKKLLRQRVAWPLQYSNLFSSTTLLNREGILLYGPTGCGKTMLACATSVEFGLNLIVVNGPELLNKYIGASEQAVRSVFAQARQAAPCILVFNELDAIAVRRGASSNGVCDRVVNQLLTYLDGVEAHGKGIIVIATTSRKDMIDPALLRPGRLGCHIYCSTPTFSEREDILRVLTRQLQLAKDVDLHQLAKLTAGFSGADLRAIITNAQLELARGVLEGERRSDNRRSTVLLEDSTTEMAAVTYPKDEQDKSYGEEWEQKQRTESHSPTLFPQNGMVNANSIVGDSQNPSRVIPNPNPIEHQYNGHLSAATKGCPTQANFKPDNSLQSADSKSLGSARFSPYDMTSSPPRSISIRSNATSTSPFRVNGCNLLAFPMLSPTRSTPPNNKQVCNGSLYSRETRGETYEHLDRAHNSKRLYGFDAFSNPVNDKTASKDLCISESEPDDVDDIDDVDDLNHGKGKSEPQTSVRGTEKLCGSDEQTMTHDARGSLQILTQSHFLSALDTLNQGYRQQSNTVFSRDDATIPVGMKLSFA